MNLKPWREIITPHKDVLEGSFKQSEFAADLTQVLTGKASEEYQNAEKFFARTFITEGMRLLLGSVAQRLSGKGGDPVIQLQTSFGGGKTHTLLSVYHMAKGEVSTARLQGVSAILDQSGIAELPKAKVAVIDGIRLSPSQPRVYKSLSINTIWGELAYQLLGEEGFRLVEAADRDGVSPGKETLAALISKAAPCVILIDELVAFIRQLESGKTYPAGTFASNMSFVQALTEAMKAVPNALLLASLPESELEVAGSTGKLALDSLEKYFGRVESVWKPVATEEAFEIVKRRLFEGAGNRQEIERTCRAFFNFYVDNNTKFPRDAQDSHYLERILQSYPIHPEVFDRLYEDWSTLEKFQRTRGVLQYLAMVIHRLWNSENRDFMILPGSIPLDDANVRTKSIHYLAQGWEPVIEGEIDGQRSQAADVDGKEGKFGALQAARRVARTIFLGSAPGSYSQKSRGITLDHILLGVAQPGQVVATYEDALKRLRDRLQYLFSDDNRYWFDNRPNLRKEMESRRLRIDYQEDILPTLKEYLAKTLRSASCFAGIHVFTASADIPDEIGSGPRLVVVEPDSVSSFSKTSTEHLFQKLTEIVRKRGEQPRQRQNRILFLVADYDASTRLKEIAKTFLAWKAIVEDIDQEKINLDVHNIKQARTSLEGAEKVLGQSIKDTYKWLMNPYEEVVKGRPELTFENTQVSTPGNSLGSAIEAKLKEEEWVIFEWSPIHLSNVLRQWYFKDGTEDVNTKRLANDFASYLYLPRLHNDGVLKNAIQQGVMAEDFFGYAQGKHGQEYAGFVFGGMTSVNIDELSLVVSKERSATLNETKAKAAAAAQSAGPIPTSSQQAGIPSATTPGRTSLTTPSSQSSAPTSFFASKELIPQKAKLEFAELTDEILKHLTTRHTTSVSITIEIQAVDSVGFDETTKRILSENCKGLAFKQFGFSENE